MAKSKEFIRGYRTGFNAPTSNILENPVLVGFGRALKNKEWMKGFDKGQSDKLKKTI